MVDILLAVYNGERYLRAQIDSIFAQTFSDWRLIIQDDGSCDSTMTIAQTYADRCPDRVILRRNERNSGSPQKNFFSMLVQSDADYRMTCDHDDVWLPDKVELTMRKMLETEENYPGKPVLVHTDLRVVDEQLRELSPSMFHSQCLNPRRDGLHQLLAQNFVTGCTMMVNRPLVNMAKRLPDGAIMHDWWFALIAAAFGGIGFVAEPTILYRQHGGNQVGAKNVRDAGFVARRIRQSEQIRRAVADTYRQAQAFEEEFAGSLSPGQRQVLQAYIALPSKAKPSRVASLIRHDFFKHGFTRRLGQLFYI